MIVNPELGAGGGLCPLPSHGGCPQLLAVEAISRQNTENLPRISRAPRTSLDDSGRVMPSPPPALALPPHLLAGEAKSRQYAECVRFSYNDPLQGMMVREGGQPRLPNSPYIPN